MRISSSARIASVMLATCPAALMAQQAEAPAAVATPAPAAAAPEGLEDIVVTATRRSERLQTVPISVTALTGQALVNAGVTSTDRLTQVTPGLQFSRNSTAAQFTVRGVSARAAFSGDESNIALYVDGVYQPSPIANVFDLLAIDRVEVLRGPQGTLFGRNATGGLINIITPDPSFLPRADFDLQYGNFDTVQARAYASAPITDALAFDVAGNAYRDEGVVRDLVSGGRLGQRESESVRGKLLFKPSDRARAVLTLGHTDNEDNVAISYQPLAGNTAGRRVPGTIIPTRPWEAALNRLPFNRYTQSDAVLRTSVDFDAVTLETTSGFQRNRTHNLTDNDASTADIQTIESRQRDLNYSQEIRLSSTAAGRFKWTAGAFGFRQVSHYEPLIVFAGARNAFEHRTRNRTQSLAGFAEGTYGLTDRLNLTLGGRYSWENRSYSYATRSLTAQGIVPLAGQASKSFNLFTPRAAVQYVFSPRFNVYGSYSRGAKSGLFNTSTPSVVPIDPEKLDAYELGFKSEPASWLRLNAAGFFSKYRDIQVTIRNAVGTAQYTNAARATLYGGEAEVSIVPARDLSISGGISLLHTNLDSFPNAVITTPLPTGGNALSSGDLAGRELIRAPQFTANGSVSYSRETGAGTIGGSATVYHSAHFFFNYQNRLRQNAYTTIGGQLWIEPVETLRISLYGDNLTNRAVLNNVIDPATADVASYARPRSYGIRIGYRFRG